MHDHTTSGGGFIPRKSAPEPVLPASVQFASPSPQAHSCLPHQGLCNNHLSNFHLHPSNKRVQSRTDSHLLSLVECSEICCEHAGASVFPISSEDKQFFWSLLPPWKPHGPDELQSLWIAKEGYIHPTNTSCAYHVPGPS